MYDDGCISPKTSKRMTDEKNEYQALLLFNRLQKRYKHLKKWANRNQITCYRLYDKDIPEIPLAIDLYELITEDGKSTERYLRMYLYQRPYEKTEESEHLWLSTMIKGVEKAIDIKHDNIITKTRKKQRGTTQYEKTQQKNVIEGIVREQGHIFNVNLSEYLDTGLFFDHRPLRKIVQQTSSGKSVLNLFCYTGAFSVYAAAGGAKNIDSVDLSNTYLEWAKKNMSLNGFNGKGRYNFIRSDVIEFLETTNKTWDMIILDPPTFSNSKNTKGTLDINRDWHKLVCKCIELLNDEGILYFSTNSRQLIFDIEKIPKTTKKNKTLQVKDITQETIPEDFRNKKIHRCWKIFTNG